ncbi:MAG: AAA family ATPase [Verrucomicrobiota bacterium]
MNIPITANTAKEAARTYLAAKQGTVTATSPETKQHESGPYARTLDEFVIPTGQDPDELLKHRYLCKGGGLLLVGPTGHGKSSLAMQLMIKWALGQAVFGLEPAKPLKSLLIQAENDDGDLAEMKTGVFNGLNLSEDEQDEASKNIFVSQESSKTGPALCFEVLDPLLETIKPDILWIDPALAYLGGDMNNQKDVGAFLRNHLAPLLIKHNCAVIIIHHTNKISKDPEKQMTDFTYMGAGSAEWSNWSRAIIALKKVEVENLYELIAAKRGARLKWKAADGMGQSFKKYIAHSKRPDTICWIEMAITDAEELRANNGKSAEDVLKHVPQDALVGKDDLIKVCGLNGIGRQLASKLILELIGEKRLFECQIPRNTVRPKIVLSRVSLSLPATLTFEAMIQNSQGHYIIPAKSMEVKKEL